MLNRWLESVCLLAVVSLTACAVTPISAVNKSSLSSSTIGVVSLLGDTFHSIHIGVTVFGNEAHKALVIPWGLDAHAASSLDAALHARGYSTRRLNLVTTQIEGFYPVVKQGLAERPSFDLDRLRQIGKQQGLSKIALVSRSWVNENDPHERFMESPYGFYQRNILGLNKRCLYVLVSVSLIDIESGQSLAQSKATPYCDGWDGELPEWRANLFSYTPAERQVFRDVLTSRLTTRIEESVTKMGL